MTGIQSRQIQIVILDIDSMIPEAHLLRQTTFPLSMLSFLLVPYPAPVQIYVPASKNQYLLQSYMQVVNDRNRINHFSVSCLAYQKKRVIKNY